MPANPVEDVAATGEKEAANLRSLRQFAWVGLLLLVLQSLTGTYLNLYITLGRPANFGSVFVLTPVLTVHIGGAFLLVIGGAVLLLYGWRTRVLRLRAVSLGAFLSAIVALQEGFAFVATLDSAFSYGMEVGFLGAMVLCGTLLYWTSEVPGSRRSNPSGSAPNTNG